MYALAFLAFIVIFSALGFGAVLAAQALSEARKQKVLESGIKKGTWKAVCVSNNHGIQVVLERPGHQTQIIETIPADAHDFEDRLFRAQEEAERKVEALNFTDQRFKRHTDTK